jgi:hypothetical protein
MKNGSEPHSAPAAITRIGTVAFMQSQRVLLSSRQTRQPRHPRRILQSMSGPSPTSALQALYTVLAFPRQRTSGSAMVGSVDLTNIGVVATEPSFYCRGR